MMREEEGLESRNRYDDQAVCTLGLHSQATRDDEGESVCMIGIGYDKQATRERGCRDRHVNTKASGY